MSSLKKLDIFMAFTCSLATLSKCEEGSVAAIIVSEDWQQVYSIGINGGAGDMSCLCNAGDKYRCIHAEVNALSKCSVDLKRTPAIMLISKPPCIQCAGLIYNAGIRAVYFTGEYRHPQGLEFLERNGIPVYKTVYGGKNGKHKH
ncbi:MAG: hypothetical protein IJ421_00105 [Prevotella sp.]|nr:hypothetical protein [Prevotella sp.]